MNPNFPKFKNFCPVRKNISLPMVISSLQKSTENCWVFLHKLPSGGISSSKCLETTELIRVTQENPKLNSEIQSLIELLVAVLALAICQALNSLVERVSAWWKKDKQRVITNPAVTFARRRNSVYMPTNQEVIKIFSKICKNFPNRKIFGGLLHVDKTYQGKHIVNQKLYHA